jgi:hypothetical protein
LVEALYYMLEGSRFESRMRWIFSIYLNLLTALWPLTEMSTRKLSGGKKRPARAADNLVAIYKTVGASTSRNPKGLHGLFMDNLKLLYFHLSTGIWCVDWILMAQVRVNRRDLVNPDTDLRVPNGWRTSLPNGRKLSSEKKTLFHIIICEIVEARNIN